MATKTRKLSKAQQRLNDYFAFQRELAFKLYETPALPGGDMGCFPAAYGKWMPPVQDLDELFTPAQREFNRSIAHKGMAQMTDADREAAARVGLTLCDFRMTSGCKGWDAPLKLVLPGMAVRNGR